MSRFRSTFRILASTFHTLGVTLALVFCHICLSHRCWARARFRIMRHWGRGMLKLCGLRLRIAGAPPPPPFLLVANHLSYLDIIVLASVTNGRFIAKQDVAEWPGLGPATASAGTIYVNRDNKRDLLRVGELIEQIYRQGDGVILFGEGTSSSGQSIQPLKPSLLAFAADNKLPVYAATLSYDVPGDTTGEQAQTQVCWCDDSTFVAHFSRMLCIPCACASLVFHEQPVTAPDRKQLAKDLHKAMLEDFRPVGSGASLCAQ